MVLLASAKVSLLKVVVDEIRQHARSVQAVSFTEAVATGLAPDGGLYLPETLPSIGDQLNDWDGLGYRELCFEFFKLLPPIFQLTSYKVLSTALTIPLQILILLHLKRLVTTCTYLNSFMVQR